jgi:hypothetical protein
VLVGRTGGVGQLLSACIIERHYNAHIARLRQDPKEQQQ